jgi:regulator of replication initiation timing
MDYGRFRSAVFGGFNRQDVLEYIEYSSRDYARQLDERDQTIRTLQQNNQTLTGETAQLRQRLIELEKTAKEAPSLKESVAKLEQERDSLSKQLEQARARLAQIEPDYIQYEAVKNRLVEIELDAHSHAAVIEQEAYDRTARVGEQLNRTILGVKEEYQSLKDCAAFASTHFRSDLERILTALDRFSGFFGEVEHTLDHMLAQTQDDTGEASPSSAQEAPGPVPEPAGLPEEPAGPVPEPAEPVSEPSEALPEPAGPVWEGEQPVPEPEQPAPAEAATPAADEPLTIGPQQEPEQPEPEAEGPVPEQTAPEQDAPLIRWDS